MALDALMLVRNGRSRRGRGRARLHRRFNTRPSILRARPRRIRGRLLRKRNARSLLSSIARPARRRRRNINRKVRSFRWIGTTRRNRPIRRNKKMARRRLRRRRRSNRRRLLRRRNRVLRARPVRRRRNRRLRRRSRRRNRRRISRRRNRVVRRRRSRRRNRRSRRRNAHRRRRHVRRRRNRRRSRTTRRRASRRRNRRRVSRRRNRRRSRRNSWRKAPRRHRRAALKGWRGRRRNRRRGRRRNVGFIPAGWGRMAKFAGVALLGLGSTRLLPALAARFAPNVMATAAGAAGPWAGALLSLASLVGLHLLTGWSKAPGFLRRQRAPLMIGATMGVVLDLAQRVLPEGVLGTVGLMPLSGIYETERLSPIGAYLPAPLSGQYVPEGTPTLGAYVSAPMGLDVEQSIAGMGVDVQSAMAGLGLDVTNASQPGCVDCHRGALNPLPFRALSPAGSRHAFGVRGFDSTAAIMPPTPKEQLGVQSCGIFGNDIWRS